jgi:hypothetical protein
MYTALESLTSFSFYATLSVSMSNDNKLVAQGALTRAASSSAGVNVAHLYPDVGRVFRVFCVPTLLSGRGEDFGFSRSAFLHLAAARIADGCRIPSLAHEIKSPNSDI